MNLLSWFSSGPEAAGKVLDAGIKGIDALVFTKEEQAAAKQKLIDGWLGLQASMGEETTVRAVTRRVIAVIFAIPFVLMIITAAVVYPINAEYAKFLVDLAQGQFGWVVLATVTFYFGPYMVGQAVSAVAKQREQLP